MYVYVVSQLEYIGIQSDEIGINFEHMGNM